MRRLLLPSNSVQCTPGLQMQVADDIPDPFYGVLNAAIAQASLRRTVHEIALGCRGLLSYLLKLQSR